MGPICVKLNTRERTLHIDMNTPPKEEGAIKFRLITLKLEIMVGVKRYFNSFTGVPGINANEKNLKYSYIRRA